MVPAPSVWRWQLIFIGSMAAVSVMTSALRPAVFASPLFLAGLLLTVVTTIVVLMLPWKALPSPVVFLVPLIDAFAIGLATSVPDLRVGYLWVIPVTWVAVYYSMKYVFTAIAIIILCLLAFGDETGPPSDKLLSSLILVLTLTFLGMTLRIATQRSRASRRLLWRQAQQVDRAAARATTHQQRVTQIIDALDTALLAVSEDGTVLNMNDAYRRLYGRDRFGARLPSPAVEYDDRRGEPLPLERTTLARATRGDELHGERVWLFDRAGRWRALEATTEPIARADDAQCATLLIIDDVTDALEAAEQRRTLTAIVSHELRNPLTAILGHVDLLLERDDLPPHVMDRLGIVANAGERMQRLVTTVLDESKPTAEVSEPVDLRQIAEASAASFVPTATSNGVSIAVTGAETLLIYGDAFRLRQAIDNLLSNAVKYTPSGGAIAIVLGVAPDGTAELDISDTGTGMSAEDVERVFQPYFRAQNAVVSDIPGTGLGMGIVRDIVRDHHGVIEVHSELGVGTRITARFPRQATRKKEAA